MYCSDTGSTTTLAPSRSITTSSGALFLNIELVLKARAAAALDRDAQHRRLLLGGQNLRDLSRRAFRHCKRLRIHVIPACWLVPIDS